MSSQQLVVRLAALGRPQQLSDLLDVVIPFDLKDSNVEKVLPEIVNTNEYGSNL